MRIALTGAHGAGKTLTAIQLAQAIDLPMIMEQARVVASEMGIESCEQLLKDRSLACAFQKKVLDSQIKEQLTYRQGFVSDRCTLDCIAYWRLYGLANPKQPDIYTRRARIHSWKGLDLIIYVPPIDIDSGEDMFRLKSGHKEIDEFIREEIELIKHRVPVFFAESNTGIEGRIDHILEYLKKGGS